MKKQILVGAFFSSAVLALSGCSGGGGQAAETTQAGPAGLSKPGQLVACIDPEYPPLEYYENGTDGEIIGFDADAARAIADKLGVPLSVEVTTFEGLMPGLSDGRCDLVPGGIYMTKEREEVFDGTAYMKTGPALILGKALEGKVNAREDLCGKTISVQTASDNGNVARDIADECKTAGKGEVKVTEYPKTAETVLAVVNGKADALIETDVAAIDIVDKNSGSLVSVKDFFPPTTTFGMFTQKDSELTPELEKTLKELYDEGKLKEIAEKYKLDPESLNVY